MILRLCLRVYICLHVFIPIQLLFWPLFWNTTCPMRSHTSCASWPGRARLRGRNPWIVASCQNIGGIHQYGFCREKGLWTTCCNVCCGAARGRFGGCVCIYMCICVYVNVCTACVAVRPAGDLAGTFEFTYTCVYIYICTYIYLYMHIHKYVHECTFWYKRNSHESSRFWTRTILTCYWTFFWKKKVCETFFDSRLTQSRVKKSLTNFDCVRVNSLLNSHNLNLLLNFFSLETVWDKFCHGLLRARIYIWMYTSWASLARNT